VNRKRVFEFCEGFAKRGYKWRTWSRVNTVDKEMLRVMKDSGCVKLLFGYESGDDRILKIINKKTTRKQNIEVSHWCHDVNLGCYGSLIYGLPGETRESIDNTVSMIKEAQPDELHYHVLSPMPGSPIWNAPDKYGLSIDKERLREKYYYGLTCLTDSSSGLGHIFYEHDQMSRSEFIENLKYFAVELDKVTDAVYQHINLEEL
jgi:radical SAM superfamily enzyme YgiQ (UPF0313 family)